MRKKLSIVKVKDARTGKIKRYEDKKGKVLAQVSNGYLKCTAYGLSLGLVVMNNRLVHYDNQMPAV